MIRFLLDTNVPSELSKPRPSQDVQTWIAAHPRSEYALSVVTFAETKKGIAKHSDPVQAARLQLWLDTKLRRWFENRVLPVDVAIAERAGTFIGEHQKQGRQLSFADALIAATAIEYNFTLVTRNVRDFQYINVRLINPWISEELISGD